MEPVGFVLVKVDGEYTESCGLGYDAERKVLINKA